MKNAYEETQDKFLKIADEDAAMLEIVFKLGGDASKINDKAYMRRLAATKILGIDLEYVHIMFQKLENHENEIANLKETLQKLMRPLKNLITPPVKLSFFDKLFEKIKRK